LALAKGRACEKCGEKLPEDTYVFYGFHYSGLDLKLRWLRIVLIVYCAIFVPLAIMSKMWIPATGYAVAGILFTFWRPINHIFRKRFPPATLQLRLSREGYAMRRGFGEVQMLHWLPEMEVTLSQEAGGVQRLQIWRLSPMGAVDWSTAVDIAFRGLPQLGPAIKTYVEDHRRAAKQDA
jgi:hypothetical protein